MAGSVSSEASLVGLWMAVLTFVFTWPSLLCVSVLQSSLLMRTSVTWDEGPPI